MVGITTSDHGNNLHHLVHPKWLLEFCTAKVHAVRNKICMSTYMCFHCVCAHVCACVCACVCTLVYICDHVLAITLYYVKLGELL